MTHAAERPARTIGILLFGGFEELDAIGPWEVLTYWVDGHPGDGWTVTTLSEDGASVVAAKGLTVQPAHSYRSSPQLDVLIYPGGRGTRAHLKQAAQLEWLRAQRRQAEIVASVCTGALVLAAAGLLAGRPATTHWHYLDQLHELDASIIVRAHDRYVDDGDVITSAGVSAGIDMALHLVARLAGKDRAREVRRGIQYDPEPPV